MMPRCDGCVFYVPLPHLIGDRAYHLTEQPMATAAAEHLVTGLCRRYPETQLKAPADFCGEHMRPDSVGWSRLCRE